MVNHLYFLFSPYYGTAEPLVPAVLCTITWTEIGIPLQVPIIPHLDLHHHKLPRLSNISNTRLTSNNNSNIISNNNTDKTGIYFSIPVYSSQSKIGLIFCLHWYWKYQFLAIDWHQYTVNGICLFWPCLRYLESFLR